MKNAATILGALSMALILSGCPIWIDTEPVDPWPCEYGCDDTCSDNDDCNSGYFCDDGYCVASWFCGDVDCPDGYECDDRDTCIPDVPVYCDENEDCEEGFCADSGVCVDTGTCEEDIDCAALGAGLACDDRGICIPDEGPCPDGACGCTDDNECDLGRLCINSRCTDPGFICVFDFECGEFGTCLNAECHATCDNASCPVGQECDNGICMTPEVGSDGCVFDEDCDDEKACINATCHPTCSIEQPDACGSGEACKGGVCRADTAPVRTCDEENLCDDPRSCIRGICRLPCAAPVNCEGEGEMTQCSDGFCRFPEELDFDCLRGEDCGEGGTCLDGACVTSMI